MKTFGERGTDGPLPSNERGYTYTGRLSNKSLKSKNEGGTHKHTERQTARLSNKTPKSKQ